MSTFARPQSAKHIELHVYVIPSALWQDRLRSAVNQVISETISAGFIRLSPDISLLKIREEIKKQLGSEIIPRDFIFCKSVGRCLTQVRVAQESELKAYHFLPPNSYCPELYLLDIDTASRSTPSLKDKNSNQNSIPGIIISYDAHGNPIYSSEAGGKGTVISYDAQGNPIYSSGGAGKGMIVSYDAQGNPIYNPKIPADAKIVSYDSNGDPVYKSGNITYNSHGDPIDPVTGEILQLDSQGNPIVNASHGMTNGNSAGESDYFKSAMADIGKASSGTVGKINLSDYPDLTTEEIRMLEGMSEEEVLQYLKSNGHISGDGPDYTDISIVIDGDNIYEDDGPQRGGMRGSNSADMPDPDFDDAHMSDMEKYNHYISLLEKYKNTRSETESRKEDLMKRAKQLFTKTASQKNVARDMWKKRYFEEKKRTHPLDEHLNKQRTELDNIHRKILTMMENSVKEKKTRGENQSSIDLSRLRIEAKKLEYEIEEAQRAVDEAKLKLTCEIKMTHQARAELVALRADLVQKKINLSTARNLQLTNMGTSDVYRPTRTSLVKPTGN